MAKVDFYFFPLSPPSRCAWFVLEELGIKYNEHIVDIFKGEQQTADYKKINVRQKVPGLKDGDLCIGESRAIATYLVSEYGSQCKKQSLYPSDPRKRAVVDQHLYIGENIWDQIISYVSVAGVFFRGEVTKVDKIEEVRKALELIEDFLKDHTYTAADNLTIADFFYYVAVSMLDMTDFNEFDKYPKIAAWRKIIAGKPYHSKVWAEPAAKFRVLYQEKMKENQQKS